MSSLPAFNGVAVRVQGADIAKCRGRFVTIAVIGVGHANGRLEARDPFTNQTIFVEQTGADSVFSLNNEVTCFCDSNTGALIYQSHGLLHDSFDFATYGEMLKMADKHRQIFGA